MIRNNRQIKKSFIVTSSTNYLPPGSSWKIMFYSKVSLLTLFIQHLNLAGCELGREPPWNFRFCFLAALGSESSILNDSITIPKLQTRMCSDHEWGSRRGSGWGWELGRSTLETDFPCSLWCTKHG